MKNKLYHFKPKSKAITEKKIMIFECLTNRRMKKKILRMLLHQSIRKQRNAKVLPFLNYPPRAFNHRCALVGVWHLKKKKKMTKQQSSVFPWIILQVLDKTLKLRIIQEKYFTFYQVWKNIFFDEWCNNCFSQKYIKYQVEKKKE